TLVSPTSPPSKTSVVSTLPISTTSMTGFRIISRGFSFGKAAPTARRRSLPSSAEAPWRRRPAVARISRESACISGVLLGMAGPSAGGVGSSTGLFLVSIRISIRLAGRGARRAARPDPPDFLHRSPRVQQELVHDRAERERREVGQRADDQDHADE